MTMPISEFSILQARRYHNEHIQKGTRGRIIGWRLDEDRTLNFLFQIEGTDPNRCINIASANVRYFSDLFEVVGHLPSDDEHCFRCGGHIDEFGKAV